MYIQNRQYAGQDMGTPQGVATGDSQGIFELDDTWGQRLVGTPGWELTETAPEAPDAVDPAAGLKTAVAAAGPPAPPVVPATAPPAPPPPVETADNEPAKAKTGLEFDDPNATAVVPDPVSDAIAAESAGETPPVPEADSVAAAAAANPSGDEDAEPDQTPEGEGGEGDGPELEDMTRNQLIEVASEYGVEVDTKLRKGRVDELRNFLDKQIYGETEE